MVPPRLTAAPPDDPGEIVRTALVCIENARAEQPRGPYLVAGVGEGGIIAHEMARQWERTDEIVHLLLIEARYPSPPLEHALTVPFSGAATLIADRDALVENTTFGWGDIFGARLRVVPIDPHERPRRRQAEIARVVRAWLDEVERN